MVLQLCREVEDGGYRLSRLWKQSAHAKLLQRPPVASHNTKHAALFKETAAYAETFYMVLTSAAGLIKQGYEMDGVVFCDAAFAARPITMLCKLLMWLQQRPELLQLRGPAMQDKDLITPSLGGLWLNCCLGKYCTGSCWKAKHTAHTDKHMLYRNHTCATCVLFILAYCFLCDSGTDASDQILFACCACALYRSRISLQQHSTPCSYVCTYAFAALGIGCRNQLSLCCCHH
jgi:hypothetical protein